MDTSFNITWNQRVHKEETSFLKFLDKRKQEEEAKNPPKRSQRRAQSDADLLSAVGSLRESEARDADTRGRSGLRRGTGSAASSSVLQKAGSSVGSSPSRTRKANKAKGMTVDQMQDHVFNQSMNRYIKDLECEAQEANVANAFGTQKIQEGHQQEIDEKTKARTLAAENQKLLKEQIEENKMRRANTRKNFVEAASAHNFPLFTETFISQDEVDQYRKDVKVDFRKELDTQHKLQETLKHILIKRDRIYAEEKSSATIKKMQDDHKADHHEKVRKGKDMMKVWDRDIRLKNIKMAILSGKDATREMGVASRAGASG